MRQSYISHLRAAGVDDADLAAIAGHTVLTMVTHYTHALGTSFDPGVRPALGPLTQEVVSATQWAHAGTALTIWMLLPLLIGIWRIMRREVAA
jgi:hypothetical protein